MNSRNIFKILGPLVYLCFLILDPPTEMSNEGFKLLERAPGVTVETIQKATEGHLIVDGDVPEMDI